ncbi:hypothetical protein [Hymenobacter nivis]|uniref:Uncharacterized protein n=1 Tax=Hymenobacter nivis TaxID=1850093 RepID=A0A2Z3GFB0_9BACT|nr:hypothetical protein [Hymenobacter nivis]AWM31488.1 hypothetical protein DDQ68_01000 [Hymenobacter nivis]
MLFLAGTQAFAQTAPSLARTDSLVAASQAEVRAQRLAAEAGAATDTVGALHRFYAARRHRGLLIAGGFASVVALGIAIDPTNPRAFGSVYDAAIIVIVAIPVLTTNLIYHAQYSHRKERRAIEAFEAHYLPAATKARLKEKYFQLPASAIQR